MKKDLVIIIAVLAVACVITGVIIVDGGVDMKVASCEGGDCMDNVVAAAKIPNVGGMGCLLTEYNRCPKFDGSYKQCTNNYIPQPQYGNCPCHNRAFEMCPQKWKVAANVYEEGAAACKPEVVDIYNPENESNRARVNWWRYKGKVPDSLLVQGGVGNVKVLY